MAKMTVYDIIKGLNQAAANAYDGSHDKRFTADGKEKKLVLSGMMVVQLLILVLWMVSKLKLTQTC